MSKHDPARGANGREGVGLESQDLAAGIASLTFAAFCVLWPDSGTASILGSRIAHGYVAAALFLLMALFALIAAPRIERSPTPFGFIRRFYPQAYLLPFFTESILLSSRALGGYSHDAAFAAADAAIFGFQPSVEFSRALSHLPWFNELMFGAYFAYFVVMIVTPWLAWFKGDREEARRQVFVLAFLFLATDLFYVFFRVQGPKYWFPELREAWYGSFRGGVFVSFFQSLFDRAVLSGAAFPSTHVMLTTLSLRSAYRMDKRLFALYLPIWALVLLSTVYIYAHYAVDGIAGAILALTLAPIAERLLPRLDALCERLGQPRTVEAR